MAAVAALTVGVGTLAGPAHADPVDPGPVASAAAIDCPAPVAAKDIAPGMVGEGWTVVRGSTPEPFRVEVLGVLTDGIGAGRDMVMIQVSDLLGHEVIDGHGIWAGMSGSPVYVNGKLLGAVSYGFTNAPSPIGGLTPATDMNKLLGVSSATAAKAEARSAKTKVTLTSNEKKTLSARATSAVPSSSLERLRTPLSVSGLSDKRRTSLQREFDAAGRSVITYAGSRAASGTSATAVRPQAGGNFAAVQTYGDVTLGGIGTTTAVCGNYALAFGHPMDFSGAVSVGANDATSLAIVTDNTFGSFKMANIGGSFGKVEQDRLAGLRAKLGAGPKTVPVTTTIRNLDSGAKRTGTTQVAEPDYLALATAYGIWANYDSTFDKIGRGLATSSWKITGVRAGKPFTVSRSNTWSDLGDPTNGPVFEAADAVDALTSNEFEPLTITGITFSSDISSKYQQLRITKMAVSVNGGKWTSPKSLRVKAGATIRVRTTMRGYRSGTDQVLVQTVKVPKKTGGRTGVLSVEGGLDAASDIEEGSDDPGCLLSECDEPEGSLDTIIKGITSVPRNNLVLADLALDEPDSGSGKAIDVHTSSSKPAPVVGGKSIAISVRK